METRKKDNSRNKQCIGCNSVKKKEGIPRTYKPSPRKRREKVKPKGGTKKLSEQEKYKRMRLINNKSSKKCREKKIKQIKRLEQIENEETEKGCVLRHEIRKLNKYIKLIKLKIHKKISECSECHKIDFVRCMIEHLKPEDDICYYEVLLNFFRKN